MNVCMVPKMPIMPPKVCGMGWEDQWLMTKQKVRARALLTQAWDMLAGFWGGLHRAGG